MSADALNPEPAKHSLLQRIAAWWMRPRIVLACVTLLVVIAAPVGYRGYCISLVPLIDEPFDVQGLLGREVPDEDNARDDYRAANKAIVSCPPGAEGDIESGIQAVQRHGWSHASSSTIKWLEDNQPALEHWRRGASKRDLQTFRMAQAGLLFSSEPTSEDLRFDGSNLRAFADLNCLDAARLLSEKKPKDAWNSLLVNFKVARHISGPLSITDTDDWNAGRCINLASYAQWARDPEVDTVQLRRALQDLQQEESLRDNPAVGSMQMFYMAFVDMVAAEGLREFSDASAFEGIKLYVTGQPQFDLRVYRHCLASILPEAAKRRPDRQPASGGYYLYEFHPSHPIVHVTTGELERLLTRTLMIDELIAVVPHLLNIADEMAMEYQLLRLMLELELFRREHGDYPELLEQLTPNVPAILLEDLFAAPKTQLRYQRNDSSIKVWSIGLNGVDDGGDIKERVQPAPFGEPWRSHGGDSGEVEALDLGFVLGKPPERAAE